MKGIELIKNLETKSKIVLITVFLALLCSYPYVFSRFFPLPNLNIIIAMELFILMLVDAKIKGKKPLPLSFKSICVIQIVIFVFMGIYHMDSFYILRFALFVAITYYSIKVINDSAGIICFVRINNSWVTLQAIMGFVGFFLILANILKPIYEYTSDNFIGLDLFYGLTTTNSFAGIIPRIAGYFDEPGAFAQWGIYSLVLNKLLNGSKKVEVLLIIGLVVTFSLAYFIQLLLYAIVFYGSNIRRFAILVITLSIIGGFIYSHIPEDSDLYYLTLRRIEVNDGNLESNNREDLVEAAKQEFLNSPLMGIGYSNIINASKGEVFDNPYETLATSGIIGTLAFYLPLLFVILRYGNYSTIGASIVLMVGYLQRPFHVQYIHYLMIYLFFLVCCYVYTKNKDLSDALKYH